MAKVLRDPNERLLALLEAQDRRIRALERPAVDPWHNVGDSGEPAFENVWVNYGGYAPARFRKLSNGLVCVEGLVKNVGAPAAFETIFTLPEGYRPALGLMACCVAQGGVSNRVDITAGGAVQWVEGGAAASAGYLELAFQFYAEQ